MKSNKKILLVKIGALGDIIMFSGVISAFKKIFNNKVEIDWVTGRNLSTVPRYFNDIHRVYQINENRIYHKNIFFQLFELIKFNFFLLFTNYDYIYLGHPDKRYNYLLFGSFFSKKILLNNQNIRYPRLNKNYYEEYVFILEKYFKKNYLKFKFPKIKYEIIQKRIIKEDYIIILPGGGSNAKNQVKLKSWPLENYLEIIKKLNQKKYKIVILGDKNDKWIIEYLSHVDCVNLINKTDLNDLMSLVYNSKGLISNDSGIIHIAALFNKKRITLFGPTNPESFNFYDKNLLTICNDENIDCSPCYDGVNFANCKINKQCMRNISVNMVKEKLSFLTND